MRNYLLQTGDKLRFIGGKIVHIDGADVGQYLAALGAHEGDVLNIVEQSTFEELGHFATAGKYLKDAMLRVECACKVHDARMAAQEDGTG